MKFKEALNINEDFGVGIMLAILGGTVSAMQLADLLSRGKVTDRILNFITDIKLKNKIKKMEKDEELRKHLSNYKRSLISNKELASKGFELAIKDYISDKYNLGRSELELLNRAMERLTK